MRRGICSLCLLGLLAGAAGAVDLNQLTPGPAALVEEKSGREADLVKKVTGDSARAAELVKTIPGDAAKAKELVKPVAGENEKAKELVKPVTSQKEKEKALVKEVVPLETTISVTPSRSRLFRAKMPIERFSISNPQLIEVIQYSPFEFELLGRNVGACSLTIWLSNPSGVDHVLRLGVDVGRDEYVK